MPLAINTAQNYNNKSFLGNSSAKPIAGVITRALYSFSIAQAKLSITGDENVYAGEPLKITSAGAAGGSSAGKGLNPNVLSASKSNGTDIGGFLAVNPTDVLDYGDEAPFARDTQIVNVGLLGSGVEMYLPVAADVVGLDVNADVEWDSTGSALKKKTTGTALGIKIISPVIDGVRIKKSTSSNVVGYEECKVAKVRL